MKKAIYLYILSVITLFTPLLSQSSNSFSVGELNPYFGEYMKPMAIGLAAGMGSGWAHEARVHKTLGFDVSMSVSAVQIPTSAMNFSSSSLSDMNADGYSFYQGGSEMSNVELPTVSSDQVTDVSMVKSLSYNGIDAALEIPAFDGLNANYAPSVALQAAVGLPKGFEIIGRYVPESSSLLNDYSGLDELSIEELNMWGIGLKYDIKDLLPFVSRVPLLRVSTLVTYSKFNFAMVSPEISFKPEDIIPSGVTWGYHPDNEMSDSEQATAYDNQGFAMEMTSITGSVLVGLNIPVIRPFIGFGVNRASASTGLTGNYPVIEFNENLGITSTDILLVKDPEQDALYVETEKTFVNFQAGANIKLGFFSIHAQYIYQEYSMYSVGLALGFR